MAHNYIYNSIAASTRQTYSAGFNSYKLFAFTFGIVKTKSESGYAQQLLPPSISSIALWITWLAGIKALSFKTIKTYLAGLTATIVEAGFKDPIRDNFIIYQLLRGVKRTIGMQSKQIRLPITSTIIRTLIDRIPRHQQCYEDKLLFAAASTGTFGLLRAGEFVQTDHNQTELLTLAQLSLFNSHNTPINIHTALGEQLATANYYVIHLIQSKADPFRFGADIIIGNKIAVQAMIDYLVLHPRRLIPTAALFVNHNGNNLTRTQLMINIRHHLMECNVKDAQLYHGHSFRKGGAQTLKELGVDASTIKLLGRWSSDAHMLYTTTPITMRLATSQRM
jgi:hypothetical protein